MTATKASDFTDRLPEEITALVLCDLWKGNPPRDDPAYVARTVGLSTIIALAALTGEPRAIQKVREALEFVGNLLPSIPLREAPEAPALPAIDGLRWDQSKQALIAAPVPDHPATDHLDASIAAFARAAYDVVLAQQPDYTKGAIEISMPGGISADEAQRMPAAEYALTITLQPPAKQAQPPV